MIVAISQPMYMPWYGIFEQIKASDIFVHYDDVQLPTASSFMTRVQINSFHSIKWLNLPVSRLDGRHSLINRCEIQNDKWRKKHLLTIEYAYAKCPFYEDAKKLVTKIIEYPDNNLASFTAHSVEVIASYLHIKTKFIKSSELSVPGHASQRILDICKHLDATAYITGLGALNYLRHEDFEEHGIKIFYPEYSCAQFSHINSDFTPYVSIIDFIAHKGPEAVSMFQTKFDYWRNYIKISQQEFENDESN